MNPYIQLEGIGKWFGDYELYDELNLTIGQGDRSALIAKNGTGKTTLLNIIASRETPDKGKVTFTNGISYGYLEQDPQIPGHLTVLEAVYHSGTPVSECVKRYEKAMASGNETELAKAIEEMDAAEGWTFETRAKTILSQLKIDKLLQAVSTLSGGEKKRLALAVLLIDDPDVLILDEPTNHLDLEMAQWLESYLDKSKKTIFMVTHDRYFLDRICNRIYELDQKKLYAYEGNYSDFITKREERIASFESEKDKAQNIYRKELEWMRRMPQARGTKQKYRKENFYKLQETAFASRDDGKISIEVEASRLGSKIFEAKNISKRFGNKVILNDFSYTFSKGEKLGIIGKNGSGKSTLLNMLTGALAPDSGSVDIGSTVKFGYYRQQDPGFAPGKRVIDTIKEIAEVIAVAGGETITASGLLTRFLFPPETQYTTVEKLSGGEIRRLYLLTVLMRNPNFLVLDEPTNDLDIVTLGILEEYLEQFSGCVIIVSHDRYFMDKITDHLMIFGGEGKISMFTGNYTQYLNSQEEEKEKQKEVSATKEVPAAQRVQLRAARLSFREKQELETIEAEIAALEIKKQELETLLSGGTLPAAEIAEISKTYESTLSTLETKELRWLELSEIG